MIAECLKAKSVPLFATWAAGLSTWFVNKAADIGTILPHIDEWVARIGLYAGAAAGLLLVLVRLDEALKKGTIKDLFRRLFRRR